MAFQGGIKNLLTMDVKDENRIGSLRFYHLEYIWACKRKVGSSFAILSAISEIRKINMYFRSSVFLK